MSVSSSDLLSLSKALFASATTEVELRNVVGRGYYAAYHAALAFHEALAQPGKLPPNVSGSHKGLAHQLCRPNIPATDPLFVKSYDLGRALMWLHAERVKADYYLDESVTRDDAQAFLDRLDDAITSATI